jgi:ATP-dependent Clp protease ATP-binding subunit ClpA
MTAKQVAMQLLEDAGVNVQQLRNDVEAYLERQPKVTLGDGVSQQKSMGRVLADVLQAGREIKSELKVSSKDVGNDLLTLLPIVSSLPTHSIHDQCVRRTPTSPRNPSSSVSAPATLSSPSKPYNPKVLHSTT